MLQAQIFIDRDDLHEDKPVYEFIMQFLLLNHIDGATVFKGFMGFGSNQKMQRPHELFSFDEPPMMITFIDKDEKVLDTVKKLREEYKGGFVITHSVDPH
jgi:hypothetical protein